MLRRSELDKKLHLFGGIRRKDFTEIPPEIQAQIDSLLTILTHTISDIVDEGYPVDIGALARLIQEDKPLSVADYEKESPYLALYALLTTNITQEQISSLSSLQQIVYAQILEGLAAKQVSVHFITLKKIVDQTKTFLFANELQLDDPEVFAQSIRNALKWVESQGNLE